MMAAWRATVCICFFFFIHFKMFTIQQISNNTQHSLAICLISTRVYLFFYCHCWQCLLLTRFTSSLLSHYHSLLFSFYPFSYNWVDVDKKLTTKANSFLTITFSQNRTICNIIYKSKYSWESPMMRKFLMPFLIETKRKKSISLSTKIISINLISCTSAISVLLYCHLVDFLLAATQFYMEF